MGPLDDPKHEAFARLVAQGKTKKEAAILAGFSKKTASSQGTQLAKRLKIAKRIDELQGKVAENIVQAVVKFETKSISERLNRVAALQERWEKLQRIVLERSQDSTMANVPGGKTGLLVRQWKTVTIRTEKIVGPPGKERVIPVMETKTLPEFSLDVGLLREMRSLEEATAKELGQTKPTEINVNVTDAASDARDRIEQRLNRLAPRIIDATAEAIDTRGPESARVN